MKKIMIVAVLLPLIAACSGNKGNIVREEVSSQYVQATPFKTLPEEEAGRIITGIGTSEKRANFTLMREAAITSAQADLARKIQSRIEAVWKRTMADWSEYKKEGFNEAESIEEMKTMQKSIIDTELRGPWQTQELIDKDSGRYWVRILYSADTVEKWVKERMQSENLLKKYIIENQIKRVQEDLQKDIDALKAKEAEDKAKIAQIAK